MSDNSLTPPKSIRARSSQRSIIRELLKLASQPDVISFAGGLPSPKSFPVKAIEKATDWVLETQGTRALQYSSTEGEPALRKAIAAHEAELGAPVDPDCIQIVSGSQQALDLMVLAYIDEGSKVAVEDPTYLGALSAFKLQRPEFVTLPTDEHGLNPDLIGPEFSGIRFAYVMPTFQNPTGITITEERRKKLAEKAREYDFWILEDNPYGELWYDRQPPKPIRCYAPERTLTMGTFSKVLSPGFRLGYIIGPKPALDPLTTIKQAVDLHTSTFTQLISARCLDEGLMKTHMPDVRALYRTQCHCMLDALERYFPEGTTWTKPDGGMFIWVTLPEYINTDDMMKEALDRKVAYVPSSAFYANEPKFNQMRLSFVTVPPEKIDQGVKVLADLIKEKMAAHNA